MLKQVLKIVALVSAPAALMVTCSQNPAQVETMGQNNVSVAAITPMVDGTPKHAFKIASNTGSAGVHIIAGDGYVYKYNGTSWVKYTQKPSGTLKSIAIPYNVNTVYVLAGTSIYSHSTNNQTSAGHWLATLAPPL